MRRTTLAIAAVLALGQAVSSPATAHVAGTTSAAPPPGVADFRGIVDMWTCSGSLVRFRQSLDTDRALVLTNGHCWEGGFPTANQVIYRAPSKRKPILLTPDGKGDGTTFNADQIVYGTMKDTDAMIYRLTSSYADIKTRTGIEALTLADTRPTVDRKIVVNSGRHKKIYNCTYDKQVHKVKEGPWTWTEALRYADCKVVPGTSGSPILDAATGTVIGVNNTTPMGGGNCQFNNPCEVDADGNVTMAKDASYGTQVYLFSECLNAQREIDISVATCRLPKPTR